MENKDIKELQEKIAKETVDEIAKETDIVTFGTRVHVHHAIHGKTPEDCKSWHSDLLNFAYHYYNVFIKEYGEFPKTHMLIVLPNDVFDKLHTVFNEMQGYCVVGGFIFTSVMVREQMHPNSEPRFQVNFIGDSRIFVDTGVSTLEKEMLTSDFLKV